MLKREAEIAVYIKVKFRRYVITRVGANRRDLYLPGAVRDGIRLRIHRPAPYIVTFNRSRFFEILACKNVQVKVHPNGRTKNDSIVQTGLWGSCIRSQFQADHGTQDRLEPRSESS